MTADPSPLQAYTFLKINDGMAIGKSLFDKNGAELVPKLMEKAKAKGCEMVFPIDWLCGQEFKNDQPTKEVTKEEGIPDGWEGMDCGPKSMELFREKILASATVIWNGPAGVFEFDTFSKGTKAVLDAVADVCRGFRAVAISSFTPLAAGQIALRAREQERARRWRGR